MAHPDTYFLLVVFLLGLVVGSFLNVVIHRLPLQMQASWRRESLDFLGMPPEETQPLNLAFPASHCPQCHTPLKPWHNIPVLSYLILRGKCAHCATRISPQYPLVELTAALLATVVLVNPGVTLTAALAIVFTWVLLVLTCIDLRHQLLPDAVTLPLLWLGLLVNTQGVFTDLHSAVVGGAAGYLVLWLVFWAFKLLTGKEGMGYGDFKLLAALGAWLGWQMLPLILLLSTAVGAAVGLAAIALRGRDRHIPMAFGPYLAIAGWIALMWGDAIVTAYLGSLGR